MKKVFVFKAWWNGTKREVSQIEKTDEGATPQFSGMVHEYPTKKDAERARNEELSKND